MATRASLVERTWRAYAALVCIAVLLLAILPCAMASPRALPHQTATTMTPGTAQCMHCCSERGTTGWTKLQCASQSQPAESAVAHPALDRLSGSTLIASYTFTIAASSAFPSAVNTASPPLLLRPNLRI